MLPSLSDFMLRTSRKIGSKSLIYSRDAQRPASFICVLNCCMLSSSSQLSELLTDYIYSKSGPDLVNLLVKIKNKFQRKKKHSILEILAVVLYTQNSGKQGGLSLEFGMISFLSVGRAFYHVMMVAGGCGEGTFAKYYLVSLRAQISGQNH